MYGQQQNESHQRGWLNHIRIDKRNEKDSSQVTPMRQTINNEKEIDTDRQTEKTHREKGPEKDRGKNYPCGTPPNTLHNSKNEMTHERNLLF